MKTQSEIKELKQVSIVGYLAGKGVNPISKGGRDYLYHSPLRTDNKPSFSVRPDKNTFYDYSNPTDTGNIIELVMRMENLSFPDACLFLENMDFVKNKDIASASLYSLQSQTSNDLKGYEVTAVKDLQHPALIRYVESRKISLHTAFSYLKEIHHENAKGQFFGVGYKNDSSGYVVRNKSMKNPINLGSAGIKTFKVPETKTVSIFEGMFDFLSCIEYCKRPPRCTAIILNSVSNLSQAMPQLTEATTIYSYLDNDSAGQKATKKMRDAGLNVSDKSTIYKGFNDFNEYWTASSKTPDGN